LATALSQVDLEIDRLLDEACFAASAGELDSFVKNLAYEGT
jgi:hypothetical protein